jgi:hypothetical protein
MVPQGVIISAEGLPRMSTLSPGLAWQTVDLHVHTPASHDYVGPDLSPEEFLAVAKNNGIDAIAVTDHNTGEWIDKLKAIADQVGVLVLPGVELTVTGGKYGSVHLLAVFDTSASTKTIENLLAKVGLTEAEYGKAEAVSPKSPEEAVQVIASVGGLPLLAHADSTKGVLHDMAGQPRNRVMNRPELVGVEVKDVERYRKMLDGTDPNYRRPLAVFRSSDNPSANDDGHDAQGIGSRFTRFKVDGLSLESLRQCFSDPDVRIRTDVELEDEPNQDFPRIETIEVSQGFLAGKFELHEGLNCLVGGKGVGKSLLIELVRFALDQAPQLATIRADHDSKLERRLEVGGVVSLTVRTAAGKRLALRRHYDQATNPIEIRDADSGEFLEGDIGELFPVLAYSQTEAIEIARSRDAQLRLIDSMLPLSPLQRELREVRSQLEDSAHVIAEALTAKTELTQLRKDAATVKAQTAELDQLLKSEEYSKWRGTFPKTEVLESLAEAVNGLQQALKVASEDIGGLATPTLPPDLEGDPDLKRLGTALEGALDAAKAALSDAGSATAPVAGQVAKISSVWTDHVAKAKTEYEDWAKQAGGQRPDLVARLEELKQEEGTLEERIEDREELALSLDKLIERRNELLDQLDRARQAIFDLRQAKYKALTDGTQERLLLELSQGADRGQYLKETQELCRGTYARETDLKALVEAISPRELAWLIFNRDAARLVAAAAVDDDFAERVVAVRDSHSPEEILGLQHAALEDVPSLRLRKDDGEYYQLADLSVGQKCTALLIVALSEADRPILVDQPEDALDIASIFADVATPIRGHKHARQFVLTTHNATVAVAGDADKFLIMKASANAGAVAEQGAIDRDAVRKEVILHLEGGPKPYQLKARKYGRSVE